jgi:hypothetical protein
VYWATQDIIIKVVNEDFRSAKEDIILLWFSLLLLLLLWRRKCEEKSVIRLLKSSVYPSTDVLCIPFGLSCHRWNRGSRKG